jgi:hypothetical protein
MLTANPTRPGPTVENTGTGVGEKPPAPPRTRLLWDVLLCAGLMLVGAAITWQLTTREPFQGYKSEVWFDADMVRVYKGMTERWTGEHFRCSVHPLYAMTMVPVHYGLTRGLGVPQDVAVRLVFAGAAALWTGLLYLTLRLMRRTVFDSLLFTGIGLASAASLFWLNVLETYVFGSVTILACLASVAAYERGFISGRWVWVAAAVSLTMTTTNFMVGVFALLVLFGVRAGTQKAVNAFFVVAVLSAVQSLVFPDAGSFLSVGFERHFVSRHEAGSTVEKAQALVFHSVVAPGVPQQIDRPNYHCLSYQRSPVGGAEPLGRAAAGVWAALLCAGLWGTLRARPMTAAVQVLLLTTAGQIALHLVYGIETFLYALHVAPLLILLAAGSMGLRGAVVFRALGVALLVLLVWNNWTAFEAAREAWPTLWAGGRPGPG